jgi:hypothetical protein
MAQRGGGSRATKRDPMFEKDNSPQGPSLRPRDLEDQSPLKLLIDKRKDLKLTDPQFDALKANEKQLKDKNAPFLKAVDSLVHELKPPLNETDESRMRMRDARESLNDALKSINGNYDASAKEALATFDAEQQKKAGEMLDHLKEDGAKMMREKLGGGGRGGRG